MLMRFMRSCLVATVALGCMAAAVALERALPSTVRLVVPYPPGGSVDTVARLLAQPLAQELGVNIVVENRPGAGGRVAAGSLKTGPSDGSVIMIAPNALTTVQSLVYADRLPYDIRTDFVPISRLVSYPFALSVSSASDIKTPGELNAAIRANPGKANFGSSGAGGMTHFSGLLYSRAADVKWEHIAFNGGAPMLTALIGGHVLAGIDTLSDHIEHSRAGKIRILGIFSPERSSLAPDIPTLREGGIEGLDVSGWFGLYGPAGMPQEAVKQLDAAVRKALQDPALVERLQKLVLEPAYVSSEEFASLHGKELEVWGEIVRESGFKPE